MKKRSGIVFLVWMVSGMAWANPVGLGLRAGLTLNNGNFPQLMTGVSQGTPLGLTGSLFCDVNLANFLSIQTEADFIQKGYEYKATFYGSPFDQTQIYSYLEIPLLIKAKMGFVPGFAAYLLAGPAESVLLNETTSITEPGVNYSGDNTSFYPGSAWSLVFGGGVEFQGFILDVRYDLGLDSVNQNAIMDRSHAQISALVFQLGYRIF